MIQKYLRVARNPRDKETHLGGVAGLLATPQWDAILLEIEDSLIKEYMNFEKCETEREFLQVKANIYALKKIAGLNGLADVVARRRIKHS